MVRQMQADKPGLSRLSGVQDLSSCDPPTAIDPSAWATRAKHAINGEALHSGPLYMLLISCLSALLNALRLTLNRSGVQSVC